MKYLVVLNCFLFLFLIFPSFLSLHIFQFWNVQNIHHTSKHTWCVFMLTFYAVIANFRCIGWLECIETSMFIPMWIVNLNICVKTNKKIHIVRQSVHKETLDISCVCSGAIATAASIARSRVFEEWNNIKKKVSSRDSVYHLHYQFITLILFLLFVSCSFELKKNPFTNLLIFEWNEKKKINLATNCVNVRIMGKQMGW